MTRELASVDHSEQSPSPAEVSMRLLVSVRDAKELDAAVAGGADWIDLKEPSAGALAAVDAWVAREVAAALHARLPLSAALGEMVDWPTSPARELLEIAGIEVVKLGLAGAGSQCDWPRQWVQIQQEVQSYGKQLAAVIYADWQRADAPPPAQILDLAIEQQCKYLLIDTYDKQSGSSLTLLSESEVIQYLQRAKSGGLTTVFAGRITIESLTEVPYQLVDLLAVRGAVCRNARTTEIDTARVRELRTELNKLGACRTEKTSLGQIASNP